MARLCGVLAYWSGCLAVAMLVLALLAMPSPPARAQMISGGGGQCPTIPVTGGCVNKDALCTYGGKASMCGLADDGKNCTCLPV